MCTFTKKENFLKSRLFFVALYLPALWFIIAGIFLIKTNPVLTDWGWTNTSVQKFWEYLSDGWGFAIGLICVIILVNQYRALSICRLRTQTAFVLVGVCIVVRVILGEIFFPLFSINAPDLTYLAFVIMAILFLSTESGAMTFLP